MRKKKNQASSNKNTDGAKIVNFGAGVFDTCGGNR